MSGVDLPGFGIKSCWPLGDCDYKDDMDKNLEVINALLNGCVCTAEDGVICLDTPPANPVPGTGWIDKATNCYVFYNGAEKGNTEVPAFCGMRLYDKTNCRWITYTGSEWKIQDKFDAFTSDTITNKSASECADNTIGYNKNTDPNNPNAFWDEFITIDGKWISTGRQFDPVKCKIVYNDTLLVCADTNADAEAEWLTRCYSKTDGLYYFNNLDKSLRICKDGLWIEFIGQDNCCPIDDATLAPGPVGSLVYWDATAGAWTLADGSAPTPPALPSDAATATHVVTEIDTVNNLFKIQSMGPVDIFSGLVPGTTYYLDPAAPGGYTATQPSNYGEVKQKAFLAISATKGQLLLDSDPCIVHGKDDCFIYRFENDTGASVPSGPVNVWITYPLNVVRTTAPWAQDEGASQFTLKGGCCYSIQTLMLGFRIQGTSAKGLQYYDQIRR